MDSAGGGSSGGSGPPFAPVTFILKNDPGMQWTYNQPPEIIFFDNPQAPGPAGSDSGPPQPIESNFTITSGQQKYQVTVSPVIETPKEEDGEGVAPSPSTSFPAASSGHEPGNQEPPYVDILSAPTTMTPPPTYYGVQHCNIPNCPMCFLNNRLSEEKDIFQRLSADYKVATSVSQEKQAEVNRKEMVIRGLHDKISWMAAERFELQMKFDLVKRQLNRERNYEAKKQLNSQLGELLLKVEDLYRKECGAGSSLMDSLRLEVIGEKDPLGNENPQPTTRTLKTASEQLLEHSQTTIATMRKMLDTMQAGVKWLLVTPASPKSVEMPPPPQHDSGIDSDGTGGVKSEPVKVDSGGPEKGFQEEEGAIGPTLIFVTYREGNGTGKQPGSGSLGDVSSLLQPAQQHGPAQHTTDNPTPKAVGPSRQKRQGRKSQAGKSRNGESQANELK